MLEYAQRRSALGCGPLSAIIPSPIPIPSPSTPPAAISSSSIIRSRKRRRLNPEDMLDSDAENISPLASIQAAADEEMSSGYTITFSAGPSGFEPAYVFYSSLSSPSLNFIMLTSRILRLQNPIQPLRTPRPPLPVHIRL